jgi:hypothetical protein
MMAMDATRIPRGTKPEIRAGKLILTNGDPKEILNPFNFGNVSQITFTQAAGTTRQWCSKQLARLIQLVLAGNINGEATAAGISMSLGALIKRHKRTLINFQESFLLPFVKKAAYRYMQFEPELYPVKDYKFNAASSLGIIAREYEVTQLVQLLQTMQQDSPLYPVLIQSIIDNMNLSNREELIATMKQASQVDPQQQQQQQQMQQAQMQAQMAFQNAQTAALEAQAQEAMARAQKYAMESQMLPQELEIDKLKAITTNIRQGEEDDREFERRLKIADRLLKEKEIDLRNRGGQANGSVTSAAQQSTGGNQQQLQQALAAAGGTGGMAQ